MYVQWVLLLSGVPTVNRCIEGIVSLLIGFAILIALGASSEPAAAQEVARWAVSPGVDSAGMAIRHAMDVHKALQPERLDSPEMTYVGSTLWNIMIDFVAQGSTAYLRCLCGLLVYDISDPTSPVLTDRIYLPYTDYYNRMCIHDHYLYAGDYHRLHIFDISQPMTPEEINIITLSGIVGEIEVHDSLLFVGIGRADYDYELTPGLYIFDACDPAAPVIIGKYESALSYRDFRRFEVVGDLVFGVNTNGHCLEVIDIQNITRPAFICSTYIPIPMDLIYDEQHVYVASYWDGDIKAFDVSLPDSPTLVGSVQAPEVWRMMRMNDKIVSHHYDSATEVYGVALYGISSPGHIVRESFTPTPNQCWNFAIENNLLLLPELYSRFSIYDFSDPYSPLMLYEDSVITWRTLDLAVTENYAYVMNENPYGWEKDALIVVDMTDKQHPQPVNGLFPGLHSRYSRSHFSISGNLLFMSGTGPTKIVSIEDPANPVYLADFPATTQTCAAAVARDNVLYTSADDYLVAGDITDPSNPLSLSMVRLVHPGTGEIELSGNLAYVAGRHTNEEPYESWLTSVDISDPYGIAVVDSHLVALQGHYFWAPDWQITRRGSYIFYAGGNTGLSVVEVGDTDGMETLFNYTPYMEIFSDVAFVRGYLFAASWGALFVFDARNPECPVLINHIPLAADPRKIRISGDYLYVSCRFGFCIYSLELPDINCGDADASANVDIDDVVYLIGYIFASGPPPEPYEAGDADCSGGVDIDDVVSLIAYIFSSGSAPCDSDGDGVPDC